MWELDYKESWALKNWCFWTMVPWTARKSKKSILKEINPEYSLEGLMLKIQYFGHLIRRADSLEKTLLLGKTEGRRRSWLWGMRWLCGITDSMDVNLSQLQKTVEDRGARHAALHGVTKSCTQLSDWTTEQAARATTKDTNPHFIIFTLGLWLLALVEGKNRAIYWASAIF